MGRTKRHHYLPEFYLAGFTSDGGRDSTFTVFDRDEGTFRSQTPKNTAVCHYYYALEDDTTGEKSMEVEEFLSSIESEAAPVIRKLERLKTPTDREREMLALFCALLHTRVPQFDRSIQETVNGAFQALARRMAPTIEDVRMQQQEWEESTGKVSEVTAEEDFERIKNGAYSFSEPRQNVIKMMLEMSGEFAELFLNMDWGIAHTPSRMSLIVTDAPLLLIPPREWRPGMPSFGLGTPGAHKMIPLSRRVALFIGDLGSRFEFVPLTKGQTRENNLALAERCERFVIGCDELLIQNVVRRTRLAGSTRRPIVVVE